MRSERRELALTEKYESDDDEHTLHDVKLLVSIGVEIKIRMGQPKVK